jgi:hypothetical protein
MNGGAQLCARVRRSSIITAWPASRLCAIGQDVWGQYVLADPDNRWIVVFMPPPPSLPDSMVASMVLRNVRNHQFPTFHTSASPQNDRPAFTLKTFHDCSTHLPKPDAILLHSQRDEFPVRGRFLKSPRRPKGIRSYHGAFGPQPQKSSVKMDFQIRIPTAETGALVQIIDSAH